MHICFLMPHHWSSSLGGAELQVRYFIEYIKRETRHDISMICANSNVANDAGVYVYQSRPCLPIKKYSLLADYPSISRHLARLAPDVVYTRTCTPLVGFAARYCQQHGKTLVYHIADAWGVSPPRERGRRAFLNKLQRPIYEYGLRRANMIVAQTQDQAEALNENYGLQATAVIPNFHPIPDLVPSARDNLLVLWVANLKSTKRPDLFVELARYFLGTPGVRFAMVGAIQDPAYESLIDDHALPDNLVYLGHQSVDEVNRLFSTAAVFVNTSPLEGFPNTFIQAWLHALPVLSLEIDPDGLLTGIGIGESFRGSLERLRDGLQELLQDEARRRQMGNRAREYAIENFSEKNCNRLLSLVESGVHSSSPCSA